MNNTNLAIFSPSLNAYSETFIQSHRKLNGGNTKFFYGTINELSLDGEGPLWSIQKKIGYKLVGKVLGKQYSYDIEMVLKKAFKKHDINCVLVEYGTHGAELTPYLDALNMPFVVHFHGYDASVSSILDKYKKRYKEMFSKSKGIISVSQVMHSKLLELECSNDNLYYNVYGPNEKFLKVEKNQKASNDFVYVGRLVSKKSPYYLVLSFLKVILNFPNAVLTIVGDGEFYDVLENLIKYYDVERNVLLVGRMKHEKVIELMQNSFCYVQHSVTARNGDMEGTPLSILESSAMGLPVISTFHAGIPDVIIDGKTGLLVEEHDVDGMAEKMIYLLEHPEIAKEMGRKGRENIRNNFSLKKHLDTLDKIIAAAIVNKD